MLNYAVVDTPPNISCELQVKIRNEPYGLNPPLATAALSVPVAIGVFA
jgi:hypothetical protein